MANFHSDLSRRGPGLLLADILQGDDPQVLASLDVIAAAAPDILLLQGVDYDAEGRALAALADALAADGLEYPHRLALRPNTGHPTGHDLDGDGRVYGPRDAHGYGLFSGQGALALLSRWPITGVRDFTTLLWRDLPGGQAASVTPEPALAVLRLASVAAWDVALQGPAGMDFHLLALHATPPVFDGPEDRNGLRNADELSFWIRYLDGWAPDGSPFAATHFALAGTLNLDPERGEGRRETLRRLLDHPRLRDPVPRGAGGTATADWSDPVPGDLRVDYVLPSRSLSVVSAGVLWPEGEADGPVPLSVIATASDHRLVWVDLQAERHTHGRFDGR